jgi:hypothetical protein
MSPAYAGDTNLCSKHLSSQNGYGYPYENEYERR